MAAPKIEERTPKTTQSPAPSSADIEVEIAVSNVQKLLAKDDVAGALKLSQAIAGKHQRSAKAWAAFGTLLFKVGKNHEAGQAFSNVVKLDPNDSSGFNNLGNAHALLKDLDKAITCYQKALSLDPKFTKCYANFGRILAQKGNYKDAVIAFRKAIQLGDTDLATITNLADTLSRLNLLVQAVPLYEQAIERQPNDPNSPAKLGTVLFKLGKSEEAVTNFEQALELAPNNPSILTALGNALTRLRRFEDAASSHRKAVESNPNNPTILLNLGVALKEAGQIDESIDCLEKALKLNPEHLPTLQGLGVLHLLNGDYKQGFKLFETRRKMQPDLYKVIKDDLEWKGQDLDGKKLLVCADQGIGDRIQFLRFLSHTKFAKAEVHVLVHANLVRLFKSFEETNSNVQIVKETGSNVYDYETYLLSVPQFLELDTKKVSSRDPYLNAESEIVDSWKKKIGDKGFKVGISWQGKPTTRVDEGRSTKVSNFQPLANIDSVRLISLQKDHGLDQLEELPEGMEVECFDDLDSGPDAFVDTAAVIANLDLVVTTDMVTAHLAGAMGIPVWVALKKVPDWRWGLKGTKSSWYPTAKLFRQRKDGNWKAVFKRIATDIEKQLEA